MTFKKKKPAAQDEAQLPDATLSFGVTCKHRNCPVEGPCRHAKASDERSRASSARTTDRAGSALHGASEAPTTAQDNASSQEAVTPIQPPAEKPGTVVGAPEAAGSSPLVHLCVQLKVTPQVARSRELLRKSRPKLTDDEIFARAIELGCHELGLYTRG